MLSLATLLKPNVILKEKRIRSKKRWMDEVLRGPKSMKILN